MTATSLDNTDGIRLVGSGAGQALLDVTEAARGWHRGNVDRLPRDFSSDFAIEFRSGQISTIAASSQLYLSGNSAFIADSTALGSNSALTGLADIEGNLVLQAGLLVDDRRARQ